MRPLPALLLLAACQPSTDPADAGVDTSAPRVGPAAPPDGLLLSEHPCGDDGVSALAWDGPRTGWIGCATAPGLWLTRDGGETWAAPATDPPGRFADAVVRHLSRSAGQLHVVVDDARRGGLVVSVDPDGWTEDVLVGGDGFAPAVSARSSAGLSAVGDGEEVAWRFNDRAPFTTDRDWAPPFARLHDLVAWGDAFYGVGSAPGQPPTLFLDPEGGQRGGDGFRLDAERLDDVAPRGELVDVEVDDGGLVAVGVDHDRDSGLLVTSSADPGDTRGWRILDLGERFPGEPTALLGACRHLDVVVAVGRRGADGRGIVLRSDDGGIGWDDRTPSDLDLPRLQRCVVSADGAVTVVGADGIVARLEREAP